MNAVDLLRTPFGKLKKLDTKCQEVNVEETIYHRLDTEKARLHNVSEQLSAHVTDVFRALGNHDVRFDFDPFSLDDCRCNFVSGREINVLCSLKHVPLEALVVEEDDMPGRVKLRLREGFTDRFDGPSWENICTESPSGDRYLNTAEVLECFSTIIVHAVQDVNRDSETVSVGVIDSTSATSLCVQLLDGEIYRVNLFASIRINELCENFQCLEKFNSQTPKSIVEGCCMGEGIHLVARPVDANEGEFWRITFNDIERRIMLSNTFECGQDCYLLMLGLLNDLNINEANVSCVSSYHLQTIVLGEIFNLPNAKKWKRKRLDKRMLGVLEALEVCLKSGKCLHVFTGVNLFSRIAPAALKEMWETVSELRKIWRKKQTFHSLVG